MLRREQGLSAVTMCNRANLGILAWLVIPLIWSACWYSEVMALRIVERRDQHRMKLANNAPKWRRDAVGLGSLGGPEKKIRWQRSAQATAPSWRASGTACEPL
jgi:hypothetical protein